jgi:hypothetical protein
MYIRAATILQSQTRRFLKRVKWTRLRTARSKSISDSVVKMLLEMVFNEILAKILKRRVVSAKIIQSFFRTYLAKQKFVKLVKKKRLKENAATIISKVYKIYNMRMKGLKLLEWMRRRQKNAFNKLNSIHSLIEEIYRNGDVYYNYDFPLNGMGIATILMRLGFGYLAHATKIFLRQEGLAYVSTGLTMWYDKPQKDEWHFLTKLLEKKREKIQTIYEKAAYEWISSSSKAKGKAKEGAIMQESRESTSLALRRIELLSHRDGDTMKKFDTIANRKMKPSTLSLIQGHFECSRKRAKMVSDLIPIRETSYFQFESYIMRFGKKDERVCKTLMSEIFEGYPATGWQPMGKKNVGYFEEEKKWELLRIRRCYELYQMGFEKLVDLKPIGSDHLWQMAHRDLKYLRTVWHWRVLNCKHLFLYSCNRRLPKTKQLLSCISRLKSTLALIQQADRHSLIIQRAYRGHRGRQLARKMKAEVVLQSASESYFTYRKEILDGTYVKRVAANDREVEKLKQRLAKKKKLAVVNKQKIREVLRYGYSIQEHPVSRDTTYVDPKSGIIFLEKPVYSYLEWNCIICLQSFARLLAAKRELRRRRRLKRKNEKRLEHEHVWKRNRASRSRLVNLKFTFEKLLADSPSTIRFRRPTVNFSLRKYRKVKQVQLCHGNDTKASGVSSNTRRISLSKDGIASNRDGAKSYRGEQDKELVENRSDNLSRVFHKCSCKRNRICVLKHMHTGPHILLKPDDDVYLSPFGWLNLNPGTPIYTHRLPKYLIGLRRESWIAKALDLFEQNNKGEKVTGKNTNTANQDDIVSQNITQEIRDSQVSFHDACTKRITTVPSSILWKVWEQLYHRRQKKVVPNIRYMGAVNGLHGLVFREMILSNNWGKNRKLYTSCISKHDSPHIVRTCLRESPGVIVYANKHSLLWTSPSEVLPTQQLCVKTTSSFVDMPYGWTTIIEQGRTYYTNPATGASSWERPEYSALEDISASRIQPIMRGFLGRLNFIKLMRKVSLVVSVKKSIKYGRNIAWVGYGHEGLTLDKFMNRLGIPIAEKMLSKLKKQKSKQLMLSLYLQKNLTDGQLKSYGIDDAENRRRFVCMSQAIVFDANIHKSVRKHFKPMYASVFDNPNTVSVENFPAVMYGFNNGNINKNREREKRRSKSGDSKGCIILHGMKINLAREFAFLTRKKHINDVLTEYEFPDRYREKILNAVHNSSFPVTFTMLHRHLKRYKSKPRYCAEKIHEICSISTCSSPKDEEQLFLYLRSVVKTTLAKADVLKLYHMSYYLKQSLDFSVRAQDYVSDIVDGNANGHDKLISRESFATFLMKCVQANLIPDFKKDWCNRNRQLRYAFPALILRIGLGWVICCNNACVVIQSFFIKSRYKCRRARQFEVRQYSACRMQALWRGVLGRRHAFARRGQYHSLWQQLYDESRLMYYFFDNKTLTSHWTAPSIPFQPYGWWPGEASEVVAPPGFCCECKIEKASRQCSHCVDIISGELQSFCFACFALKHSEQRELITHTFTLIAQSQAAYLTCIECDTAASVKCSDCEDFFCKACFKHMHRKGNRKFHKYYTFTVNAEVCIECNHEVATHKCIECRDFFCKVCFAELHKRGRKSRHEFDLLNSTTDGQVATKSVSNNHTPGKKNVAKPIKDWRKLRPTRPPPKSTLKNVSYEEW